MSKKLSWFGDVGHEAKRVSKHSLATVGSLASATEAVAKSAEMSAWTGYASSASEWCAENGISNEDGSALPTSEAYKTVETIVSTLRGY